jgi:hypothetical protein
VQGHYGEGYGDLGFQAGFIYFLSAGCWEITGKAGDTSLTYVTLVVQLPFEPVEPTWLPEGLHRKDYDFTDYPTAVQTVWAFPTLEVDQVVWSNSEVRIETTQNLQEGQSSYPDAAQQPVIVNGQPGICVQGIQLINQGQWEAQMDAGFLEWSDNNFTYHISYIGVELDCEDLLRIVGSSS